MCCKSAKSPFNKQEEVHAALQQVIGRSVGQRGVTFCYCQGNEILLLSSETNGAIVSCLFNNCLKYPQAKRFLSSFAQRERFHLDSMASIDQGLKEKYNMVGSDRKRSREHVE